MKKRLFEKSIIANFVVLLMLSNEAVVKKTQNLDEEIICNCLEEE